MLRRLNVFAVIKYNLRQKLALIVKKTSPLTFVLYAICMMMKRRSLKYFTVMGAIRARQEEEKTLTIVTHAAFA